MSYDQFDNIMKLHHNAERSLTPEDWLKLDVRQRFDWEQRLSNIRHEVAEKGLYHPTMLKLLKRVRCKNHPIREECDTPDSL